MPPSDRAAWLARVERMTRQERLMALATEATSTAAGGLKIRAALRSDMPSQQASSVPYAVETFHHANRALDLIAALERSAKIEVLEKVLAERVGFAEMMCVEHELARLRAEAQQRHSAGPAGRRHGLRGGVMGWWVRIDGRVVRSDIPSASAFKTWARCALLSRFILAIMLSRERLVNYFHKMLLNSYSDEDTTDFVTTKQTRPEHPGKALRQMRPGRSTRCRRLKTLRDTC